MKLKTLFLGGLTGLIFVATPLSYAHADNWQPTKNLLKTISS